MRLLLLNQFYPPDPAPTGQYLHDLARMLVRRGHTVRVLCSRRAYDGGGEYAPREFLDGVEVIRLRATGYGRRGFAGKLADYSSFYALLLWAVLNQREQLDAVLSLTTPPYLGLLGKIASGKARCAHVHWIMDLYPDVMFARGMGGWKRWGQQLLQGLTRRQLRGAVSVIALGPCMADKIAPYLGWPAVSGGATDRRLDDGPLRWIPLWSDPELSPWPEGQPIPLRFSRGWAPDELVLLYAGNMGLGHRLGEFLEAAKALGPAGPRWVFSGGGKRRVEVEQFTRSNPEGRVELMGYVPKSGLREHLCAGDVHLASLEPAWQGFMVPSKLQASFAVGRPVLFVGGDDCETARWIRESGGGWVVTPGDVRGVLDAVRQATDSGERRKRGLAARAFALDKFDRERNRETIAQWLETGGR